MSFLRPEAVAGLKRWREVILAGAVVLLGLYWVLDGVGFMRWIGTAVLIAGLALAFAAAQRARFHGGHGGLGVVEVTEGQITYLAPAGGGMASIDALTEVSIAPDRAGLPVWRFRSGIELLSVPVAASGTERLFDVFTALPGLDLEQAIRASRSRPREVVVLWRRGPARLH